MLKKVPKKVLALFKAPKIVPKKVLFPKKVPKKVPKKALEAVGNLYGEEREGGNPCTCNCTPTPAGDPTPVWPDRFLFSCLPQHFDEEHKQHSNHQPLSEHLVMSFKFINSLGPEDNLPDSK